MYPVAKWTINIAALSFSVTSFFLIEVVSYDCLAGMLAAGFLMSIISAFFACKCLYLNSKERAQPMAGLIAVILQLYVFAFSSMHSSACQAVASIESAANLSLIGRGINSFYDVNGSYPPAYNESKTRTPLLSWRVLILPHIGEHSLYNQFDLTQAWDSARNAPLIARMPACFRSPCLGGNPARTNYCAITGPGTAFEIPPKALKISDFADGFGETLLIVESANSVIWSKPEDINVADRGFPNAVGLLTTHRLPGIYRPFQLLRDSRIVFFNGLFDDGSVKGGRNHDDFIDTMLKGAALRSDGLRWDSR